MIETLEKVLTTKGRNNKPVVLIEASNGCIICTSHGAKKDGYSLFHRGGKLVLAHRLVYEAFYGPIPEGIKVCHHCDYPPCLNPEHFFAGTQGDNMRDKAEKGRVHRPFGNTHNRGEKDGMAKLTAGKVLSIRRKYQTGEYSQRELGREYGVGYSNISLIVNNKTWQHLGGN